MGERFIPLIDHRSIAPSGLAVPESTLPLAAPEGGPLLDRLNRPLHDLRISVTDRCNFRCGYCMPKSAFDASHAFLPQKELLSFEEITRLARVFTRLGVRKLRLTGGEPLLRRGIERLIEQLAALRTRDPGADGGAGGTPLDLTLTTNGSLLARKAEGLKAAGLQRVTVSLDALDDATFRRMNDMNFPVADVLDGLRAAVDAGLGPIKLNMVVKRGTNDREILPMARHFRDHFDGRIVLRFIEYMDVGATNGWRRDEVLPSAQVLERIDAVYPLRALAPSAPGETSARWAYADGGGEIGVISSVTQAFCGDCNRARLSTEGKLYLCLFASGGHDLRALLRDPAGYDDAQIAAAVAQVWQRREDRYSELRGRAGVDPAAGPGRTKIEMSYIGG